MEKTYKKILDLRGYTCPFPLILVQREVKKLSKEHIVEILVTDPSSCTSISLWAEKEGHKILSIENLGEYNRIILKVKARKDHR